MQKEVENSWLHSLRDVIKSRVEAELAWLEYVHDCNVEALARGQKKINWFEKRYVIRSLAANQEWLSRIDRDLQISQS